jgi:asparagine synthase (glutamine-hydrolysing)
MCGIAGVLSAERGLGDLIRRMTAPIRHRGPDDEGFWVDEEAGIAFGHRRLSIVDLSPLGHQPMFSANGRFVVVFNGEIYNHLALRGELDDSANAPAGGWRGHSDTETLIEAIAAWGLTPTLSKSVGMFAFALWDRQERTLTLARDRFGEKPLYYGWVGRDFAFGSELKAIRAHPRFDNAVSREAVRLFSARGYIPAPLSIYEGVHKLEPGQTLTLHANSLRDRTLQIESYYSYRSVVEAGLADPIADEACALDALDEALRTAVADQSVADVPVGMFLSGGIDSSTIAALYQVTSRQPVRTFSIGFTDPAYNEAPFARKVADYLGTVHTEQIITEHDALAVIPSLPSMYDEPFADSSQIPTYLVSRLARGSVTVALTGDGGDELFGGYYRHFYAPQLWRQIRRVPRSIRAAVGVPLSRLPTSVWDMAGTLLPNHGSANLGAKIQKALRVSAAATSIEDVYETFLDEWSFEPSPVLGAPTASIACDMDLANGPSSEIRMMYSDAVSYMPDDILCKVDRASMAVSLETRVPFLDHRVAELAARIPIGHKIRGGTGKVVLRDLLYRHAPRELFDRPKAGFAIPVGDWLRGPLRSWAEELLDERRLAAEGWFDARRVRRRWEDHLANRRQSAPALWALLMFQAWLQDQQATLSEAA